MSANLPTLDPEHLAGDAFLDAVLGVARVFHDLGELIDGAHGDGAGAAGAPDDLVDAILGLVSLRKTVALILAAASTELVDAAPPAAAAWSRELLR